MLKRERFPGGGLERWLITMIESGGFRDLPLYYPVRERDGQPAETYARALLGLLRLTRGPGAAFGQVCDDGRAFRSWAEAAPASRGRVLASSVS
jgi:hypothetical protein